MENAPIPVLTAIDQLLDEIKDFAGGKIQPLSANDRFWTIALQNGMERSAPQIINLIKEVVDGKKRENLLEALYIVIGTSFEIGRRAGSSESGELRAAIKRNSKAGKASGKRRALNSCQRREKLLEVARAMREEQPSVTSKQIAGYFHTNQKNYVFGVDVQNILKEVRALERSDQLTKAEKNRAPKSTRGAMPRSSLPK